MKRLKNLWLMVPYLIGLMQASLQAHIFDFSNHTNYPLRVGVKLSLINEEFKWMEIQPREQGEFLWVAAGHPREKEATDKGFSIWKAGICLQEIQVQTPRFAPKQTIDDDGNIVTTYEPMIKTPAKTKDNKILKPAEILYNAPLNVVITWVKNEAYNAIVEAGKLFADGFADLAAKTASVALGGVSMPQFKLSPIAEAIGTWSKYSFCRDRHIDIIEDEEFSTNTYKSFKFLIESRG